MSKTYTPDFPIPYAEKDEPVRSIGPVTAGGDNDVKPQYSCKYCGRPSHVDPSDQTPPPDYCQDADHEEPNGEAVAWRYRFWKGAEWNLTSHPKLEVDTDWIRKEYPNYEMQPLFDHPSNDQIRKAAQNLLNAIEYGQGPTLDEVHQEYKSSAVDEAVEQLRQALANIKEQ